MRPQVSMKGFTEGPSSLYICSPWALKFYIRTVDNQMDRNLSAVWWDTGKSIYISHFFQVFRLLNVLLGGIWTSNELESPR